MISGKLFFYRKVVPISKSMPRRALTFSAVLHPNGLCRVMRFLLWNAFIRNHSIQYPVIDLEMSTSRLAVYRFFKQAREAGVMLAIFYLADILSAYEDTVTEERWQRALRTSHTLLDCWFNHYNEVIDPTEIIGGDEVMEEFHLRSGKIVGDILENIREAQAGGIVNYQRRCVRMCQGGNRAIKECII